MNDYDFWWFPLIAFMLFISGLFFSTFYEGFKKLVTYEINWLFIIHLSLLGLSLIVFKEHILNFIETIGSVIFEGQKIDTIAVTNAKYHNLNTEEINNLDSLNKSIISNLETTGIAIFALFIPFMFSLYINFYKDTFTGIENIVKKENEGIIDTTIKNDIISIYNNLNRKFFSYMLWLKILFFSSVLLLLILIFSVFILHNIDFVIFKNICLNFLKWLNSVVIISFITLLFAYLFLIIPYYKNLNNSSIFIQGENN